MIVVEITGHVAGYQGLGNCFSRLPDQHRIPVHIVIAPLPQTLPQALIEPLPVASQSFNDSLGLRTAFGQWFRSAQQTAVQFGLAGAMLC
ncbi:MAG: hypothetical protein OXF19_05640 [Hyphomicrobiales bacterium]|nr:hypothetical protein [Hyphomicrobiales bacterium]